MNSQIHWHHGYQEACQQRDSADVMYHHYSRRCCRNNGWDKRCSSWKDAFYSHNGLPLNTTPVADNPLPIFPSRQCWCKPCRIDSQDETWHVLLNSRQLSHENWDGQELHLKVTSIKGKIKTGHFWQLFIMNNKYLYYLADLPKIGNFRNKIYLTYSNSPRTHQPWHTTFEN